MHCVLHGVQCSGPPPSAWAAGTSRGAKDSVVSFSHLYQSSEMETEEVGSRRGWEVSGDTNSLSEKVTFDQRPRSSKGAVCVCAERGTRHPGSGNSQRGACCVPARRSAGPQVSTACGCPWGRCARQSLRRPPPSGMRALVRSPPPACGQDL